jgi:hypothetical protein
MYLQKDQMLENVLLMFCFKSAMHIIMYMHVLQKYNLTSEINNLSKTHDSIKRYCWFAFLQFE